MGIYPKKDLGGDIQTEVLGDAEDWCQIVHQVWTGPVVADPNRLLAAQATSDSVITEVTTFLAQPDIPRNIEVLPGGTTADVPAGDVTIDGTDINDQVISEALTFEADQATLEVTARAFKTVTKVTFPIQAGAGATYDVGIGDILGLKVMRAVLPCIAAFLNSVLEPNAPTIVGHATSLANNTILLNTALDTNQVDAFLVV